jgi:hypothetical protein
MSMEPDTFGVDTFPVDTFMVDTLPPPPPDTMPPDTLRPDTIPRVSARSSFIPFHKKDTKGTKATKGLVARD